MTFIIHRHDKGQAPFFWATIVARNGRILFTSETYTSAANARKACLSVYKAANKHGLTLKEAK